jgi:hypothetical protein
MTSTLTRLCAAAALIATFSAPAAAQQIGPSVSSDLDKDGLPELFHLADLDDDSIVELVITRPGKPQIVARDIAWRGGIGQQPELSLAENGSVRLTSGNDSIGRGRWHLTLTIAYRRGAYRVAGYTYDWYDTLELADNGICDLNLLSGKGIRQIDGGRQHPIRTSLSALPVTEWTDSIPVPPECSQN